jgi:hypothetical protein
MAAAGVASLLLVSCAEMDGDLPPGEEAETAGAWFPTPWGHEWLHFEIVDGHAIYQGDIDLGPISELYDRGRGGAATPELGKRWPNSTVRYWLDMQTMTAGQAQMIRDSLDRMEALTPLNFVELSMKSGNYVRFSWDTELDAGGGVSDSIGMKGGEQNIKLRWPQGFNDATIHHEVGHAIGLWHEQSRADRDLFVDVHLDCVLDDKEHNYDKHSTSLDLGPYDFGSIMHYRDTSFCVPWPGPTELDPDGDGCLCKTLTPKVSGAPAMGGGALGVEDVNTIYRMYGRSLGTNDAGEYFGSAVAVGDFDGDGYGDVAVGVPGQPVGNGDDVGIVRVLKGTSDRLIPWTTISQSDIGGGEEPGDQFGTALAAGDFDFDGFDDLAVGVPYEDVGNVVDSGAVYVFFGSQVGLDGGGGMILTQTTTGLSSEEAGDLFGYAVVAGDFNGDDRDDLVVGAPLERNPVPFATMRSGAVFGFTGSVNTPLTIAMQKYTKTGTKGAGDRFGASLAAGRLDDDDRDDLVVGSPEHGSGSGAGAVYVFAGQAGVSPILAYAAELRQPASASPISTDDFGWAVAIGDFENGNSGNFDIAVGAPGKYSRQGRVFVFEGMGGSLDATTFTYVKTLRQSPLATDEDGDEFGFALAAGHLTTSLSTATHDLVVGVPGEDSGGNSVDGRGGILVYESNDAAGLYQSETWAQNDAGWFHELGDRFGESLAVGTIDDGPGLSTASPVIDYADIVVGAPGEGPEIVDVFGQVLFEYPDTAGAICTFLGGSQPAPDRQYHQASVERD